jgi:hypothetical protein
MSDKRLVHQFRVDQILEYCRQDIPIDRILVSPHWLQMNEDLKWESSIAGTFAPLFDKFPGGAIDCVIALPKKITLDPGDIPSKGCIGWLQEHHFAVQIHGRDGYEWALTMIGGMLWESHPRRLERVKAAKKADVF